MPKRARAPGSSRPTSFFASLPAELRASVQSAAVSTDAALPAPTAAAKAERGEKRRRVDGEGEAVVDSAEGGEEQEEADDEAHERALLDSLPRYTSSTIPTHLRKYWAQRHRLFSLFSSGILLDDESWFSVTPETIAAQIAERCRCECVLDAFCGVGGNAIQFAWACERVIAIDIDPLKIALAKHNAAIYGVADRITFICTDFLTYASEFPARKRAGTLTPAEESIEVVFLSPPWGGVDYLTAGDSTESKSSANGAPDTPTPAPHAPPSSYPLAALRPRHGKEIFELARGVLGEEGEGKDNIAYFLPRNTDLREVGALAREGEAVEVEEEWMSGKLKAVTCYYGELARRG